MTLIYFIDMKQQLLSFPFSNRPKSQNMKDHYSAIPMSITQNQATGNGGRIAGTAVQVRVTGKSSAPMWVGVCVAREPFQRVLVSGRCLLTMEGDLTLVWLGLQYFKWKLCSLVNPETTDLLGDAVKSEHGCLPWLIVVASFAVSFIQVGFSYSYGLLLPAVASHFKVDGAKPSFCKWKKMRW